MTDWTLRSTPTALRKRYLAGNLWTDESLGRYLDAMIEPVADRRFRIWSDQRPYDGTIGDVRAMAGTIAAGLRARGLGAGDVIAFQLPNSVEAVAAFWAVTRLGAVLVPIVHFYGPKELGHILRESGARALITADAYGWLDYQANLETLRPELPDLDHVFVVPMGDGAPALGAFGSGRDLTIADVDPDAAALIAYTSGTTADPKGVIHTHRSIVAEGRQLGSIQPNPPGARSLINGAPIGHAIGMLAGILVPLYLGQEIHLADGWEPPKILAAMLDADAYAGSGATFFLLSLLDDPTFTDEHLAKMHHVGLGGSSVPAAVGERATELGISVMRSYGSTEHPSTTGATHDEPVDRRIHTDGHALAGVEIRIVDDQDDDVEPGTAGEILSRGPDLCAGYTDPAQTAQAFDADGWYHTGDIGVLDADGWLTITDRLRDIIIRGGETISPVEVEDLLLRLAAVAEVAVVGAPDQRLGEHGCAFVRLTPDTDGLGLGDVQSHLADCGLAKQKWPEELRVVDDLPRTPSGKIKKFELRARLREAAGGI